MDSAKESSASLSLSDKSGWVNVPQDVASILKQKMRKAMCKFEIADGTASASTIDGLLTLSADAKATRFKNGDNWFSLSLDSVGREGEMRKAQKPVINSDGAKLPLIRKGFTEWYVNHGKNIEHGIVLIEKPLGKGNLTFSFVVSGNLIPEQNGNNITFVGNENMNYAGIKAWDATGANLVCSMSVDEGKLLWQVNDTEATYPVTVDPIVSFVKKITASDADGNDYFGYSVSLSGDLAIVGADYEDAGGKNNAGAAYIFSKDKGGSDNWGEVAKITASDADANDHFGYSVSLSGDLAIVGAYQEDAAGKNLAGAAYIFSKDNGGSDNWGEVAKITPSDADARDFFGYSVSLSGDLAIVGAYYEDADGKNNAGAAYIFSKDKGGSDNWGEVAKITASDAEVDDEFGISVSLSGDLAIVGADYEDAGGKNKAGAAYIFSKDKGGSDNWGEVAKITASDADARDFFGYSVSLSGDLAIVGANLGNADGESDSGAAYIFNSNSAPDKIIVPVAAQPSGAIVSVDSCSKNVCTKAEVEAQYQSVNMGTMLGANVYEFNATVTSGKVAYFCFNSSSLGDRKAGEATLFKLFKDKDSKTFTYSADKYPTEEGSFWITDEANSGQYMDPNMILTGGQSYTVNYSIKDNGEYDINTTLGQITDPVVLGASSGGSSGCVMNPQADFTFELAGLVLIVLTGMFLRRRRVGR